MQQAAPDITVGQHQQNILDSFIDMQHHGQLILAGEFKLALQKRPLAGSIEVFSKIVEPAFAKRDDRVVLQPLIERDEILVPVRVKEIGV